MTKLTARRLPVLKWSIGARLIVIFVALAIIPMSATAYYNLTEGKSEVNRIARENLMGLSGGVASNIEQVLIENQRTSATLAGEPLAAQFLDSTDEEREALTPQVYQMLQNFADTHPDYDAPGLLDENGIVVASLAEVLVGKDRSFRDYFQASILGESYVSDMLVGRATGRPGVFLTNPVITEEEEIVGIDIVWLKADTIWSIIDDVSVNEGGNAFLVDQDGVIIGHPNRELLYRSLGELTTEAVTTISETIRFGTIEGTDTPLVPESLGMDDLAAVLISSRGSDTCRYYSSLDNCYHVVGHTRLEGYPWTVVVDVPEAQFLAPMRRLESVAWLSVGVMVIVVLLISLLLARSITRPIRRLTDTAMAVENGHPFEPSDINDVTAGHDETAKLGKVFSSMVVTARQELAERKRLLSELEDKTKELEQILYTASHDLRSPLVNIQGFAREMEESLNEVRSGLQREDVPAAVRDKLSVPLDEDIPGALKYIRNSSTKIDSLLTGLLQLSRLGRTQLTIKELDMNKLIANVISTFGYSIKEKGVTVEVEHLPPCSGDRAQINQLFSNLIDNALKFLDPARPGSIRISGTKEDGRVVYCVEDNGIGIATEHQEKVFEIFQQLEPGAVSGEGLGLTIVRRILDRHSGKIWLESEPGKGSKFYIALPAIQK